MPAASPTPLVSLPARLVLRFPRRALSAIEHGTQHQFARRLRSILRWSSLAAVVLMVLALVGIVVAAASGHPMSPLAMVFLVGLALVRILGSRARLDNRTGLAPAPPEGPLARLREIDEWPEGFAGIIAGAPVPLGLVEVSFLLVHPEGQARLRAAGLERGLLPAHPGARPRL